ncbi:MAG TPA: tetratricopeptide repeat protein [Acidobacteriota bacterium]|nr:tetratricopeptide repeat protein [Acidobacteriota bacterium]
MRRLLLLVALSSIVATVYLNSFPAQFHYDDFPLMLENPRVTSASFDYASFLQHYGGRPLTLWSFYLNYQLFGAQASVFHAVNLVLHILATCLLMLVVGRLSGRLAPGFLAAFIFAVHPLQTQAVNYIWSRSILLMTVFIFLSGLLIRRRPILALICFQLAIWSRAEAIVMVLPLLLISREFRKPLVGTAALNSLLFLLALSRHDPSQFAWNHTAMLDFWKSQTLAAWKYLQMMIWPTHFSIDYQLTIPSAATAIALGAAMLLLVGGLTWLFFNREDARIPAGSLLLTVFALTPSLLMPNTDLFNESRSYLALAFFAIAASWTVLKGGELFLRNPFGVTRRAVERATCLLPFDRPAAYREMFAGKYTGAAIMSCLLVAILFVPTTLERNRIWRSDMALWVEAAERFPGKGQIRYNLGVALARAGNYTEALKEFQAAARLMPDDDLSYAAIGYCAEMSGDWPSARRNYQRALSLNPGNNYAAAGLRRVSLPLRGQEL